MSITIRTALEEDFIAMYKMDLAANATHPFYVIPWKTAGPGACKAFILDRYQYLYHSRNPKYTFIVATAGDEIVGYLIYQKNPGEDEPEEWNPNLPDGTNLRFFEKVIPEVKAAKKHCNLKDCWELEGFAVHPNWQRKGIGSMLVKKFLEAVDADRAKCYVHSSKTGKSLYEKFGFRMIGVVTIDLKEFGDYEPYTTWDMQREAALKKSV